MTGIAPSELLADETLYDASIEQAEQAQWSSLHEAVACTAELVHWLVRVQLGAHGVKPDKIPAKFRYPRPGDKEQGPVKVTAGQLAAMMRQGGARGD